MTQRPWTWSSLTPFDSDEAISFSLTRAPCRPALSFAGLPPRPALSIAIRSVVHSPFVSDLFISSRSHQHFRFVLLLWGAILGNRSCFTWCSVFFLIRAAYQVIALRRLEYLLRVATFGSLDRVLPLSFCSNRMRVTSILFIFWIIVQICLISGLTGFFLLRSLRDFFSSWTR